jgi:predicted adenylyl cyclase CyaB
MPNNIEIKAKVNDVFALENLIRNMTKAKPIFLSQEDIFFNVPHGRLKLRIFSPDKGELIFYDRPNIAGPKQSAYVKSATNDPQWLKDVLLKALGMKGIVRKIRKLYLHNQTRIHIDDVEGLGHFVELEVMLQDNQATEDGIAIAENLMLQLHIEKQDLIDVAYIDLMESLILQPDNNNQGETESGAQ